MNLDNKTLLTLLPQAFERSELALPQSGTGKVRDWYTLPGNRRLFITTDRLSAFDRNLAVGTGAQPAGGLVVCPIQ